MDVFHDVEHPYRSVFWQHYVDRHALSDGSVANEFFDKLHKDYLVNSTFEELDLKIVDCNIPRYLN